MWVTKTGKNEESTGGIVLTRAKVNGLNVYFDFKVTRFFKIPLEDIPLDCYKVSPSDSNNNIHHNLESLRKICYTKHWPVKDIVLVSPGFWVIFKKLT